MCNIKVRMLNPKIFHMDDGDNKGERWTDYDKVSTKQSVTMLHVQRNRKKAPPLVLRTYFMGRQVVLKFVNY